MTEEKDDYVDDDLEERRRRWEGIHNDEAAQSRLPFDNTSQKEQEGSNMSLMEWVFGSLGCLGVTAVSCYGLYKLILILF